MPPTTKYAYNSQSVVTTATGVFIRFNDKEIHQKTKIVSFPYLYHRTTTLSRIQFVLVAEFVSDVLAQNFRQNISAHRRQIIVTDLLIEAIFDMQQRHVAGQSANANDQNVWNLLHIASDIVG